MHAFVVHPNGVWLRFSFVSPQLLWLFFSSSQTHNFTLGSGMDIIIIYHHKNVHAIFLSTSGSSFIAFDRQKCDLQLFSPHFYFSFFLVCYFPIKNVFVCCFFPCNLELNRNKESNNTAQGKVWRHSDNWIKIWDCANASSTLILLLTMSTGAPARLQ